MVAKNIKRLTSMFKFYKKTISKFRFFPVLVLFFSPFLKAETSIESTPLTRELIISFVQATNKMGRLNKEYPELAEHSQEFDFNQSEKVIQFLKGSAAYPKIVKILKDSKFDELEQVFNISQKVMGGLYYLNKNDETSTQSISQFETIRKVLEDNLKTLKKQDKETFSQDNAALIEESENQLKILDQQLIIVKQALASLSPEDKIFLDANGIWFKHQFVSDSSTKQ